MREELLSALAIIPQVIIATCTVVVVYYAFKEYTESKKAKKLDKAFDAFKHLDSKITPLTQPALTLVRYLSKDNNVIQSLKHNRDIVFDEYNRQGHSFEFLISDMNIIPAAKSNELRIALVHYLNAWENVALLYNSGIADRKMIEDQLIQDDLPNHIFDITRTFMDTYGKNSWESFRNMVAKIETNADDVGSEDAHK